MKKIMLLLGFIALLMITLTSWAQAQTGKISGDVSDNTQKLIESATVSVLKAKDSSLVKMGVANKSGVFEIDQLPMGKYLVAVSAVGFAKTFYPAFELNESNPSINLKRIVLAPVDVFRRIVLVRPTDGLFSRRCLAKEVAWGSKPKRIS